ncbi:Calpain-7 [Seminavis robusta]|uniref:Calpain-7 n=1 Tax=Seminavis robusta TaxID=568900 RepID=A0A9N8DW91_9STRA|nr:Calpain-7 [Seminavis robusta]|eukprot:Sro399_g134790.1 Calpain-7 (896) ;mRNA; r:1036-4303
MGDLLDDVFRILATATKLEDNDDTKIEAATKYYEAIYLMRQYIQRLPATSEQQQKRDLLEEKAKHYEKIAQNCLRTGNSLAGSSKESPCSDTRRSITTDPRSPIAKHGFFNEDSSVVPLPPPSFSPVKPQSPRFSLSALVNQTTSQANAKLATAMDADERGEKNAAIATYMDAAELYLKAMKAAEDKNGKTSGCGENVAVVLRRRLEQTLDRVEQLKNPKPRQPTKVHMEQRQRQQQQQRSKSSLTPEEVSVLTRSSLISSGLFLPWSDDDAQALNAELKSPMNLFRDKGDLPLADKQKKTFYKWARPSEILQLRQHLRGHGSGKTMSPVMVLGTVSPYKIKQYGVTDCSFIASLCICAAYERRFQKSLISPIVYPQTPDGKMVYNPNGKYMVKLWLNGVARQVVVDDRLPIDKNGNLLCANSQSPPGQLEIYVPIIEKAFLKMAGGFDNGYNFPGSNSGVDLYALTGWIPERILFPKDPNKVRDHETSRERAWERLMSAHSFGDCLITMSSEASISEEQANQIGLVTGHAYACLSVMQTQNGIRLLQLKNPWAHKGWKGRYSCYDTINWNPKICAEVGYNPELAKKSDDGVFWICWDDVLVYFQNVHLSWNPDLFAYRTSTHGFWPKALGPRDDTFNCGENPQYAMTLSQKAIKKGASIWILISRHVTKSEQEGAEVKDYLTVHLHRNDKAKERIFYPRTKRNVLTGAYTNNPHCLVRYDVTDPADEYLSIVLSQYEKSHDLSYTLSCFCTEPFTLGQPAKELPFSRSLTSSWTPSSAGGPIGKKGFYSNPMFAIEVPDGGATFQIQCLAPKTLAVNVMLVPVQSYGQRATRVTSDPPVDSGNYRHGFVVTKRQRAGAGPYALVVSAYNAGEVGTFKVKISTSVKISLIDEILS